MQNQPPKHPSLFSIEQILSAPNKKPRRGFLINELLGEVSSRGRRQQLIIVIKICQKDLRQKTETAPLSMWPRFQYKQSQRWRRVVAVELNPRISAAMISSPLLTGGDIPINRSTNHRQHRQHHPQPVHQSGTGASSSKTSHCGTSHSLWCKTGVRTGRNTYDAEICVPRVVDHWNNSQQQQHRFAVFIFGSSGQYKPLYKYINDHYDTPIVLYLNNQHFDGVQKLHGLFGQHYCLDCEKPYQRPSTHLNSCKARCLLCSRVGPAFPCVPLDGFFHQCAGCNKKVTNATRRIVSCATHFTTQSADASFSPLSQKSMIRTALWPSTWKPCSINQWTPSSPRRESTSPTSSLPELRALSALRAEIGGGQQRAAEFAVHIELSLSASDPLKDTRVGKRVVADKPTAGICGLAHLPASKIRHIRLLTLWRAFRHGSGLPRTFPDWIQPGDVETGTLNYEILYTFNFKFQGNKMYEMKVRKQKRRNPNIVFRDSFNLMPCALAALIPSYGLDVEDKPFFPHLANRPENYGHEIHPMPDDYLASGMMPSKRQKFDEWYAEHRHEPFKLDEALASYCSNDVEILIAALVAFRREFFEISRRQHYIDGIDDKENHNGIDVLRECMTIAGACMRHFRTNHLPDEHLAIVHERGYDNAQNQSLLALRFFHWYAKEHGVQVQTAHAAGGEKRIGPYSLDGWIEAERRAIELNGCTWHGCKKCYPNDNMLLPSGKSAGQVRESDFTTNIIITQPNIL
ncbi:hypothetical protein niasHT_038740 [Heterodera trifolii]|uniref:DNA-directed DNA polymerase n=1 Tax=Heterodera trifolii TaxID=157864 RepID=A0ABD2IG63_9BILA